MFIFKIKLGKLLGNESPFQKVFEKFKDNVNPNIGSFTFKVSNHNLFQPTTGPMKIARVIVKDTEFLLQRESNMMLVFQHVNPKTGTRISRLDINDVGEAKQHMFVLIWSEKEIRVYMGVTIPPGRKPVQGDFQKV